MTCDRCPVALLCLGGLLPTSRGVCQVCGCTVVVLANENSRGQVVLLRCPPARDGDLGQPWKRCHRCMLATTNTHDEWRFQRLIAGMDIEDLRDL